MRLERITAWMLLVAIAGACPAVQAGHWKLEPFAVIVGGVKFEDHHSTVYADPDVQAQPEGDQDRFFTMAISQFGLRAKMAGGFALLSEFEANGGVNSHGSSVWEGQAALQVRRQLLRFERWGLRVDAGHVQDDSSIDYISAHVLDMLLNDIYTRRPYLASGANHGNGLYVTYDIWEGLGAGVAFNAGSPISTSATPMIGGTYNPYPNFYGEILKTVGDSPNRLPSESQHFVLFSPSLTFDRALGEGFRLESHASVQLFQVDTNMASTEDDPIEGINLRAGLRAGLWDDMLVPFANFSWVQNNVTGGKRSPQTLEGQDWSGMTLGGGIDWNFHGRSGVGLQYMLVRGQQGDLAAVQEHHLNLGGTWWLDQRTSVGARVALYRFISEDKAFGEMSYFLTARVIL